MNRPELRPLSFGEILDGTFALYRRNFLDFFLASLVPLVPIVLAWMVLGALLPRNAEGVEAASTANLLLTPYSLVATVLVWGALTHMADGAYAGERIGWRQGLGAAFRRLLPLLGAMLLTALLVFVGLLLLMIPGVLAFLMFFAVVPAVMVEKRGAVEAMGRSRALARGAWGRILGVLAVLMIIVSIPSLAFGVAGAMGMMASGPNGFADGLGMGFALWQASATLVSALATPLFPVGILLLYYDRRVRAEGLDLELATQQLASEP